MSHVVNCLFTARTLLKNFDKAQKGGSASPSIDRQCYLFIYFGRQYGNISKIFSRVSLHALIIINNIKFVILNLPVTLSVT